RRGQVPIDHPRSAVDRKKKWGKRPASHRYDRLPLLPSGPGGFSGSWSYRTCPGTKVSVMHGWKADEWIQKIIMDCRGHPSALIVTGRSEQILSLYHGPVGGGASVQRAGIPPGAGGSVAQCDRGRRSYIRDHAGG